MSSIRAYRVPADPSDELELITIPSATSGSEISDIVGGCFQAINLDEGVTMWINEDGKANELTWNQRAQTLWNQRYGVSDYLVGQAVLTGGAGGQGQTLGLTDIQLEHIEQALGGLVRVKVENTYADGHESVKTYSVSPPEDLDDLEDWWETTVYDITGDGHGAENPKLGSLHECTVLSGPASLLGETYEFGG